MDDVLRTVILPKLGTVRKYSGGWMAKCPAHDDGTASLSVSTGKDHPVVLHCHADCSSEDILARLGLTWADVTNAKPREHRADDSWMPCGHTPVATYEYRDPGDVLVFVVVRCSEKGKSCQGFRQWRPDPTAKSGRRWSLTLPDGTRAGAGLLYRLPEVLAARQVEPFPPNIFVVEGEKDANRLWTLGLPATCNAGGAGKWTAQHAAWLAGADVIVVADRDEAGWKHAETVVNSLAETARTIEVLRAAQGKDLSDHLDAGLTVDQLVSVAVPKADR